MNIRLKPFPNIEELISQCVELFHDVFPDLDYGNGVMLAGGRTPLEIYRRAATEDLVPPAALFLSDERYVPSTDPQSNYGTIAPLFKKLIPVKTELPLEEASQAFHDTLARINQIPLGLLGLGTDGHTASLFNLKDAALRDERLAIPVIKPEKPDRISVTPTLLNRVDRILLLATGAEKIEMIQTLLKKPKTIPAGVALADHPSVEIWTDQKI